MNEQHLIKAAGRLTVGEMLRVRARAHPGAVAIQQGMATWTYAAFNARVNGLANSLAGRGLGHGDRIAILAENRVEYLELVFAAAKLGAIVCALNWRLAAEELVHCIHLTTPKIVLVSDRHKAALDAIDHQVPLVIGFGEPYEAMIRASHDCEPSVDVDPEDGLIIIYTSGTTGFPKGALLSHRAQLARMQVNCIDFGLSPDDAFVAWPPMFHMVSTDQAISLLCLGGKVIVVDGFAVAEIVDLIETERQWWLVLMPGMVEQVIHEMRRRGAKPKGIKLIGAMADLLPRQQIAEITSLLQAPYANTFGSTETGLPPASKGRLEIGVAPASLSKQQNSLCDYKLVDADDNVVPEGAPGELAFRGPTLFSGYWNAPNTNEKDFRGGYFHMGDAFVRRRDGTLDFVDRVKYLIKSGGENIYPAEIERVLLADPGVADAVVVRRADPQWGEVPVAFVARKTGSLTADSLTALCREKLAGYKRPKEIRFVELDAFPRSTTGKIQRHEVEKWL